MSERRDTLQQYVSDMLALERHILEAIERQAADDRLSLHTQASTLITRIQGHLNAHITHLEQQLTGLGGEATSPVKEAVVAVAGVAAGLYDKVRTDPVSKMLRDDYTALNLAAISYSMLHTTGLAFNDFATADLALRHLKDLTPCIVEINEIIPLVVAREISDEGTLVDTAIAQDAVRNTQAAWSQEVVQQ